jgi:23S rRNA pseudouridine1911/1915/1917 synthase
MSEGGRTLAAVVREKTGVSWSRARDLCTSGRVTVDGEPCVDPATRLRAGAEVAVRPEGRRREKGPLARSAIVHYDRDIVIVDKPPGMLAVPDEPGNKDTLAEHARTLLRRLDPGARDPGLGVVHRIDRDTSGLMVFTRTAEAKRHLAAQFRSHELDRAYHAIAHGVVADRRIESYLLEDRGDGLRGSHGHYRRSHGAPPAGSRLSVTHVRALAALSGATLVECRLETGRQHQVRIHLSEAGHPLLGERVYVRDFRGPVIPAPRTMLHARTLAFIHPRSGAPVSFEREPPADFQAMLDALRITS